MFGVSRTVGALKRLILFSSTLFLFYLVMVWLESLKLKPNFNVPRSHLFADNNHLKLNAIKNFKEYNSNRLTQFDLNFSAITDNSDTIIDKLESKYSVFNFEEGLPEEALTLCPEISENANLIGQLPQASLLIEELEEKEVEKFYSDDILPGGSWKPTICKARHKVAIIIPYRDRKSHLVRLLDFVIPILKKQFLDFRFVVTEQVGENLFNKGRLMNAAFKFSWLNLKVDCVIFHDVDMFPQDDRVPYDCPRRPRHIGAYVSSLGYQLWYNEIALENNLDLVGGVLALTVQDYLQINGFSNCYWAWGGEDDDMGKRIISNNFTIERPNIEYVRFSMLKHVKRKRLAPKLVYNLLSDAGTRWIHDGVNETNKWTLLKVDFKPLYHHLMVDVGDPPADWKD